MRQTYVVGAIAGALATVPMTACMLIAKRYFPWRSQDPLPPVQITREALRTIDAHDDVSRQQQLALAGINHFAYGATMGAAYARLVPARSPAEAVASGAAFGLAVWGGSYLGWLPALGMYRSATEETSERNATMIAAHLVWGGSLGLFTHLLSRRPCRLGLDGRLS